MSQKTHWLIATAIGLPIIIAIIVWGHNEIKEIESNYPQNVNYNEIQNNNYDNDDYKADVNDWMADQAAGKDYDYDDGGSYYCMGKNDTCNRKTNNAYDLYCSSCDPDGDNVEG